MSHAQGAFRSRLFAFAYPGKPREIRDLAPFNYSTLMRRGWLSSTAYARVAVCALPGTASINGRV